MHTKSRLFAIGDIHARFDLLQALLKKLEEEQDLDLSKDKLIFMGDMIDRYPNTKEVINTIMELQAKHPNNVIALCGNHENMALLACATQHYQNIDSWYMNGGVDTVRSYGFDPWVKGPKMDYNHLDWLVKLPLFHREPGFFFSHAPLLNNEFNVEENFSDHELTWTYIDDYDEGSVERVFNDEVVGVCGHIHRLYKKKFEPRLYKNYIYTDVGCGCSKYAGLAAVEVVSRTVIQVNPEGWEERNNE